MTKKLSCVMYVLVYVAVYFLSQIISVAVKPLSDTLLYLINGEHSPHRLFEYFLNRIEGQKLDTVYIYLATIVLTLAVILYIIYSRKKQLSAYVKKKRLSFKEIFAAFLFAYGLSILVLAVTKIPALTPYRDSYESNMQTFLTGNLYSMFLIVALLGPVFEEVLFRGVILGELKTEFSFISANIIQSLLFGLAHLGVMQGVYSAVLALFLGFIYFKTENIYTTILIHILFNAFNPFITEHLNGFCYLSGAISVSIGFLLIKIKTLRN